MTLLGTEAAKARALADELDGAVKTGQVGDALSDDVVVFAVWYPAVDDVLARYGDQLDGKVVSGGLASSKRWATCTWPSRSRSDPTSAAP